MDVRRCVRVCVYVDVYVGKCLQSHLTPISVCGPSEIYMPKFNELEAFARCLATWAASLSPSVPLSRTLLSRSLGKQFTCAQMHFGCLSFWPCNSAQLRLAGGCLGLPGALVHPVPASWLGTVAICSQLALPMHLLKHKLNQCKAHELRCLCGHSQPPSPSLSLPLYSIALVPTRASTIALSKL